LQITAYLFLFFIKFPFILFLRKRKQNKINNETKAKTPNTDPAIIDMLLFEIAVAFVVVAVVDIAVAVVEGGTTLQFVKLKSSFACN